ncbi:polysaccharide deacetylase family protein [Winogradskyella sp.]|uniref:polysaccharide deacetylase family protein n=1 Tax=Winogradskyella sp. TaxID=1883156 RepID=UPI003F6D4FC6
MNEGKFVISLDFELHWGFFDNRTLEDSKSQLSNVENVIEKLLELCNQYNVSITFATVGMLFAENKREIIAFLPKRKPNYTNKLLNTYELLDQIQPEDEKYYFAKSLVNKVANQSLHEIGTHTFSHYYCHEDGQNINDFKDDISSAIEISKSQNTTISSIVFPRNQSIPEYIKVCEEYGISTYRGNCWFNFNNDSRQIQIKEYAMMACRVIDSYVNISGKNTYKLQDYNSKNSGIINIPASRFLRPYNAKLKAIEKLKVKRIKRSMTKAAENNEIFHLWFHPHNFANNIEENFQNLESIFKHYKQLHERNNFDSITMSNLANQFLNS